MWFSLLGTCLRCSPLRKGDPWVSRRYTGVCHSWRTDQARLPTERHRRDERRLARPGSANPGHPSASGSASSPPSVDAPRHWPEEDPLPYPSTRRSNGSGADSPERTPTRWTPGRDALSNPPQNSLAFLMALMIHWRRAGHLTSCDSIVQLGHVSMSPVVNSHAPPPTAPPSSLRSEADSDPRSIEVPHCRSSSSVPSIDRLRLVQGRQAFGFLVDHPTVGQLRGDRYQDHARRPEATTHPGPTLSMRPIVAFEMAVQDRNATRAEGRPGQPCSVLVVRPGPRPAGTPPRRR